MPGFFWGDYLWQFMFRKLSTKTLFKTMATCNLLMQDGELQI